MFFNVTKPTVNLFELRFISRNGPVKDFSVRPFVTGGKEIEAIGRLFDAYCAEHTTTGTNLDGSTIVTTDTWRHIALVYDGTNKYVYIDGFEDARMPTTGQSLRRHREMKNAVQMT